MFLSFLSCPSKGSDVVANVLFGCGKDCVIVVLSNMDGAEKGFVCDPCFVQALDQTLAQCLRYRIEGHDSSMVTLAVEVV